MSNYYENYWKDKPSGILDDFAYKWPSIKKLIPNKKGLKVLDFGCGMAKMTKEMAMSSPLTSYFGVDISREAIRKSTAKKMGITLKVINNHTKLPFKKSFFDFIVAADVIEHIFETKETLIELHRVLKNKGKLLITTPYHGLFKNIFLSIYGFESVFDPTGPHIRFFTPKSLKFLLEQTGFIQEKIGYFGRFYPFSRGFFSLSRK